MNREINVQIGTTRSTVEGANITPGKHWLSDLIAGCQGAWLAFPVCVTTEHNHPMHLVVNQELPTMPLQALLLVWLPFAREHGYLFTRESILSGYMDLKF